MKTSRTPAVVLVALCLSFLVGLVLCAPLLPERVATHFGAGGRPNGWMSRSTHLRLQGALGVGLPLVFALLAWVVPKVPPRFVSLPHREYWMSPLRQAETCDYISRRLLWLACLEVVFFAGVHFLTVQANRRVPVQLPMEIFLPLIGGFLVAVVGWAIAFIRHFTRAA